MTIRRDRIETRVANRLREALLTPELTARFEAAIRAEQKELRKADPDQPIKRLRKQRKDLDRRLENYFKAIGEGMKYESVKDLIGALETQIAETEIKLSAAEAERREAKALPPEPVAAYAEVLRRLEELLGHPDFVHQAHEHLSALIHKITLRPDTTALDGMAAEILWDLGSLLSAGGYGATWADRFSSNPQLTVGCRGQSPRRWIRIRHRLTTGRRRFAKARIHFANPAEARCPHRSSTPA